MRARHLLLSPTDGAELGLCNLGDCREARNHMALLTTFAEDTTRHELLISIRDSGISPLIVFTDGLRVSIPERADLPCLSVKDTIKWHTNEAKLEKPARAEERLRFAAWLEQQLAEFDAIHAGGNEICQLETTPAVHIPTRLGGVRFRVFKRDGYRCQMCGATSRTSQLHLDHKVPRAKGGSDEESNLWVLCQACNLSKGVGDL